MSATRFIDNIADLEGVAAADQLPATVVYTTGSYDDPAWITSLAGSKVSGNIPGNAASITGSIAESQVTGLTADLAAKAADSAVVHLAGTETITGAKTFSVGATVTTLNVTSTTGIVGTGELNLFAGTNKIFRGLVAPSWADSVTATHFQVGTAFGNAVFATATAKQFTRFLVSSFSSQVTNEAYSSTPVPTAIFEVIGFTGSATGITQITKHRLRCSSGAPSNGFGARHLWQLETSLDDNLAYDTAYIDASWASATHATRKGKLVLGTSGSGGEFPGVSVANDGTQALIGLHSKTATPVAQGAAIANATDAATAITQLNLLLAYLRSRGDIAT